MFKKSPSRNQRSKGFKIKHVLQICLLLGVCFWLIYQIKRSYNKRKEFDEKDVKGSVKAQSDDVILKFGRKDLPRLQDVSKNYKHEEEEDGVEEKKKHGEEQEEKAKRLEEEGQEGASKYEEEEQEEAIKHEEEEREVREDEGSKHDDDEPEAENKDEEAEDEGRGDDEQENVEDKGDHEEEFLDEEKEREAEGDDKGNDEKDNEEKEGQEESDNLVNNQNHDEGGGNAHEAREEQYKADDASSAVSHDTQSINSEAGKLDTENSNYNSPMSVSEHENKTNATQETNGDENRQELKIDEGKHSEGSRSLNVTYTKENDQETGSSNSLYISLPSTTNTTDFIDRASNTSLEASKDTGNNPAEVNTEIPGSLQNGSSAQNKTEDGMVTEEKANEMISKNKQPDSNTADLSKIENVATTDSSNSSTDAEFVMSVDIAKVNGTARGGSFGSSMTKEVTDSTQNEKSVVDNESVGADESSDNSSSNKIVDGGQHDLIDSSGNTLPQDEKDARLDLSTLPDITTEESNNEDAAAE